MASPSPPPEAHGDRRARPDPDKQFILAIRDAEKLTYPVKGILSPRKVPDAPSRGEGAMELTDELKVFLGETARTLKGSTRRVFMARAVRDLGAGGA